MPLHANKVTMNHKANYVYKKKDDDLPEVNNNIQVGQSVTRAVNKIEQKKKGVKPEIKRGTVVYIHPERRFYITKFELDSGETYYESYLDCRPSLIDETDDNFQEGVDVL